MLFVASCKSFNNGNVDKNGKEPMVLKPISGTSPRGLNVISGTSAELQGFEKGKMYIVDATEGELYTREDGTTVRSFNFDAIAEVNPFEALAHAKSEPVKLLIQPETEEVTVAQDIQVEA